MDRARTFYERVFDTRLERLGGDLEMWVFPQAMGAGGTSGALVKASGVPSGGNSTLVYFACEDVATEAGRVAGAGGKLAREKMSIGQYGFIALAHDTEGNLFGLHSLE
jgi:predicted enzyme related to lactoylglutathione lyase